MTPFARRADNGAPPPRRFGARLARTTGRGDEGVSPPRSDTAARWRLGRLAVLSFAACALLAGSLGASPASGQDGFEPDEQVIADVRGYAAETQNGHAHVLRWMRVLHTFDALSDVTSAEAQGFADTYWALRWDPIVAELEKLEQGASTPDAQVVADVRDYSEETANGADHVLRWYRVLHTFGALTAMTAAEAQGHAVTFTSSRWGPVVAALAELEASQAGAADGGPTAKSGPTANGGPTGDGGPAGSGGPTGNSDGGVTGDQAACTGAPTVTAEVLETHTVSGSWTVPQPSCDAGGVYVEFRRVATLSWSSSPLVSAGSRRFIHGQLRAAEHKFRVRAVDASGIERTSNEVTLTPVAGTEGIEVVSNLAGESYVKWSPSDDATGYTIRYREANTFDFSTVEVPAQVCSTGQALADCSMDEVRDAAGYKLGGVLDASKAYWVEVGTKTTSGSETVTRYSKVSRSSRAPTNEEPFMAWFIDGTPLASWPTNRMFMTVDSNQPGAAVDCHLNNNQSINCPPRTLVSLDINQGGTYRTWMDGQT